MRPFFPTICGHLVVHTAKVRLETSGKKGSSATPPLRTPPRPRPSFPSGAEQNSLYKAQLTSEVPPSPPDSPSATSDGPSESRQSKNRRSLPILPGNPATVVS